MFTRLSCADPLAFAFFFINLVRALRSTSLMFIWTMMKRLVCILPSTAMVTDTWPVRLVNNCDLLPARYQLPFSVAPRSLLILLKGPIFLSRQVRITILALTYLLPLCLFGQTKPDYVKWKLDSIQNLNEVTVSGSTVEFLRESPGNLSIVDVKPFYNSNITTVQLLKQSAGIKVKQDGGYGSRVDFFINGSTGKQIKFFLDGIPLDNLGETQGVNNLPVELIERIEVYKGVLPVDLGSDALGGAINIITRKDRKEYLDASYAISSFDTHRLNVLGKKYLANNFYTSLQASGGYSKNNYKVRVGIPNENYNLEIKDVKRFHDRYQNYLIKAEAGLLNQRWADQLILSVSQSALDRQLQNNLLMTQPYGKAFYRENLYNAQLKYQKNQLAKKLSLSSQTSFNRVNGLNVDTSGNVYVWDGRVFDRRLKPDEAEYGPAKYLHIYTNIFNEKLVLAWRLNDATKISMANTFQFYRRTGKDTLARNANAGIDFYSRPSTMFKNVGGLSIESVFLDDKLKASASIKHFYAAMSSYELVNQSHVKSAQNINDISYNLAVTYPLSSVILLKASYERAVRLPDVEEAFGNLMLIRANPSLKPEKSNNINLNVLLSSDKADIELSAFFKDVSDMILLQTDTRGSGTSRNLNMATVTGVEASITYRFTSSMIFNINGTYQDLRNKGSIDPNYNNGLYYNARVPNIPYLMANAGISWGLQNFIWKDTKAQVWLNGNYTNQYFLYWAVDGDRDLKNRIPNQFLQNAGISVTPRSRLTFTLESYNLSNQKTYDNFNVQLPGRSFSFKTRIYLYKNPKSNS